jgi:hypothetical protein
MLDLEKSENKLEYIKEKEEEKMEVAIENSVE